ncbi:hypothetical protein B1F73_21820 [Pseudomonas syringae]|uniref:Uncharacterized protein n=1 Tax=Pseudomonas syringae TaxID=317 RepID=A0AB37ZDV2_PSESX|nr:hypothetical protein B1F71_11340 [Pseudomonas syringae]SDG80606.1 hypothetical protein SAMN05444503_10247 [Pseudomonas sp. BS3767]SDM22367.1 hypothetical protein SAMN05444502_10147 [Pseudomonas sp. BS3759]RXT75835.1 hypothetical protein B1F77_16575 [Pseudomonas syringae]RXT83203.1 hypothetical protein B1F72_19035 [Pseudomonas syringae]
MGGKRKPFITTKAVSEAVVRSGETRGWTRPLILEVWELSSLHLSESVIRGVFSPILAKTTVSALFDRNVYTVTGREALQFECTAGLNSDPGYILSEMLRELITKQWPMDRLLPVGSEWNDFTEALFETLFNSRCASRRLRGWKLELDLGI